LSSPEDEGSAPPGEEDKPADQTEAAARRTKGAPTKRRKSLRPWLRALHRDMGYVAVGLTLIYALSGLAVNHIKDWDPNFHSYSRTVELGAPLVGEDEAVADEVRKRLGIEQKPSDVYRGSDERLDLVFDKEKRTVHVDTTNGRIVDEGQKPRLLLRAANWLHLNRGKKAWTYIADGYAAGLLFLAISGLFMIPGRKGLWGRGGVLLLVGVAIPVVYLQLAGDAIR
jgi:uncharacterized protein